MPLLEKAADIRRRMAAVYGYDTWADYVTEEKMASYTALRDPVTGQPLTVHGAVLDMIQCGFEPLRVEILYDKLKKIVTMAIDDIISDYHVSVPLSAEAFIVPGMCCRA